MTRARCRFDRRMSNARCRRPDGELQKNKTPLGRGRGLVARWDDRTKLFMRSRIGNDAVALTLEGHRRPREVLEVRHRQWDRGQLGKERRQERR